MWGWFRMPTEVRFLLFSDEEASAAIIDWRRRLGEPLPTGFVAGFDLVEGDGTLSAVLTIENTKNAEQEAVALESSELTEALVLMCKRQRIPLAARSLKSVDAMKGQLALVTTINMRRAQPQAADGGVRYSNAAVDSARDKTDTT